MGNYNYKEGRAPAWKGNSVTGYGYRGPHSALWAVTFHAACLLSWRRRCTGEVEKEGDSGWRARRLAVPVATASESGGATPLCPTPPASVVAASDTSPGGAGAASPTLLEVAHAMEKYQVAVPTGKGSAVQRPRGEEKDFTTGVTPLVVTPLEHPMSA